MRDCGLCGSSDLVKVLDFGDHPLANAFLESPHEKEERYPLRVYFCRSCASVQLLDIIDPTKIFIDYVYLTSASKPMSDHFIKMGNDLCDEFITSKKDVVLEIGGSDGVLCESIKDRCWVLNYEPSEKAAKLSLGRGVNTVTNFFNFHTSDHVLSVFGNVDLIISNNVMAHIPNLRDVFLGVEKLLKHDGVFVFEVHWLGNLITTGGFDQIYHEHIYYHSLTALKRFIESTGMSIFRVEMVPIHGESIRVFVSRNKSPNSSVQALLNREEKMGLDREDTFINFADKIDRNKQILVGLCKMLRKDGKSIVGYGAPAKGNTLLNHYGIMLDYIVDTTPLKHGLFTPGMHIEVSPPRRLFKELPDYALLLAWNYADSILEKEKRLMACGTRFIIPVPVVQII
jgi:methylation protein EvaC